MTANGSWKTTILHSGTPQLLLKTRFDGSGYQILLTDLSRVWEETLTKKEIIKRAIDTGCSFNPGDDDDNYDMFLKSVEGALNSEEDTTANLRSSGADCLLVDTTTALPGSLPALKWTVRLTRLQESAVAEEIVNPLILEANSLRSQIQSLVDEISAKDRIIEKITDKLVTSGNDLTAVFPGISNVKLGGTQSKSTRSKLAIHVRGLGDFDEAAWRASSEKASRAQDLTPDILDTVLRDIHPPDRKQDNMGSWLDSLPSADDGFISKGTQKEATHNTRKNPDTQEDTFQRQDTPPNVRKKTDEPAADHAHRDSQRQSALPTHTGEDSETEDEEDDCLDIAPTTSQQQAIETTETDAESNQESSATAVATTMPRPLGSFNARKAKPSPPDPDEETEDNASSPIRRTVQVTKVKPEPHGTDSEMDSDVGTRKPTLGRFGGMSTRSKPREEKSEIETHPESVEPRTTLGRFGGKPAQPSSSTTEPASKPTLGRFGGQAKTVSTSDKRADPAVEPKKLGRFGGKKAATSPSPPRKSVPKQEKEPERELTGEEKLERADQKREKLKRELAEKAKAPAPKKRKF